MDLWKKFDRYDPAFPFAPWALYCFLNSPEYIALVGAQFQKHGTGQFETTVVDPDHPIINGLEPFRTWDETYVHTKYNTKTKDRHVLQTRDDRTGSEPWTWTRTRRDRTAPIVLAATVEGFE